MRIDQSIKKISIHYLCFIKQSKLEPMLWAHSHPSNIYLVNCFSGTTQNQFLSKNTQGFIACALVHRITQTYSAAFVTILGLLNDVKQRVHIEENISTMVSLWSHNAVSKSNVFFLSRFINFCRKNVKQVLELQNITINLR